MEHTDKHKQHTIHSEKNKHHTERKRKHDEMKHTEKHKIEHNFDTVKKIKSSTFDTLNENLKKLFGNVESEFKDMDSKTLDRIVTLEFLTNISQTFTEFIFCVDKLKDEKKKLNEEKKEKAKEIYFNGNLKLNMLNFH